MTCPTCGRREVASSCNEGFVHYLSGDYTCPFNPAKQAPRNLVELPPLSGHRPTMSAEGLEDLL